MGGDGAPGFPIGDNEGLCETAFFMMAPLLGGFHLGFAHRP